MCCAVPSDPPLSTYRLQLTPDFGFDEVAAVAPYLAALGVSHVYFSPYLQAAPGSTHGYDVVDHSCVNRELGGADGHSRMCKALGQHALGQVLDIVPNHMAIGGRENAWWWDVLENGPSSRYAGHFDVDWDPPEAKLRNTVLLPILGDHYGRVLERGELNLVREEGSFIVRYGEHLAPVAPRSLDSLLADAAERAGSDELAFISRALRRLPPSTATDRASVDERHRDKEVLRAQLAALCRDEPAVARAVDAVVAEVNADPDALHALLDRQNYRLALWKTAGRELDYRRFFDINTLIGLRVEDEAVFEDTHRLVLDLVAEGTLDGIRIDHPDGLRDPEGYLRRLHSRTGGAWVVVEKILEGEERLPSSWLAAGTTGYDFLNQVLGLFVDPSGEAPITRGYRELTGDLAGWEETVRSKKHQVLRDVLAADVTRITSLLVAACERDRRYRDHTRHECHEVVREVAACFPVYRTYVHADERRARADDEGWITAAVEAAKASRDDLDAQLFDFLRDLLLLRTGGEDEVELVMRFQQLTGPVMAKGVEDTAFYTYRRFLALNEVGGDPGQFGRTLEQFHAACRERAASWPAAMLATSTHDTKRSEDVRARLAVLSEMASEWNDQLRAWFAASVDRRPPSLDAATEHLIYQTVVGAWPIDAARLAAYVEKATKEAKERTSWIDPDPDYDRAVNKFVHSLLDDTAFVDSVGAFVDGIVDDGRVTSLSQTLVKLTAPGAPDIYQGTEIWDLSLVDPDNRRPVDFEQRQRLLADLGGLAPEAVWARRADGLPKLLVTTRALQARRLHPEVLGPGASYEALAASGDRAEHLVAFVRGGGALTLAPRLVRGLAGDWQGTTLEVPAGRWRDQITGEMVPAGVTPVSRLLARFPVALLLREDG